MFLECKNAPDCYKEATCSECDGCDKCCECNLDDVEIIIQNRKKPKIKVEKFKKEKQPLKSFKIKGSY